MKIKRRRKVEDDGLAYSSIQVGDFVTKLCDIKVRPLVLVYTPAIDRTITDNWIVCELLIETEKLRRFNYFQSTYNFVKELTLEMHKEFTQTGVYFTNEEQDGKEFAAFCKMKSEELWQFDH